MSTFIVAFDIEKKDYVIGVIRQMKGVTLASKPAADGTVRVRTKLPTLDAEADTVHAIEDIDGVLDLRLIQ
ncbi:MAG: hypothetical protein IT462_08445 [Planctomycetes bacterium]|nr:hypothetical protein [Planctomycetota bacterium]